MSKAAKIVSQVAAIVGTIVTIVGVVTGNPVLIGIGAILSAVSAVAGAISAATAKPPDMQGSLNSVVIGRNLPIPYAIGRTYVGGFQVYDNSNGGDRRDRSQIMVVSAAGPIEAFETFLADYSPINFAPSASNVGGGDAVGYYSDYMFLEVKPGNRPEAAFTNYPGRAALREWDASYKLSGYAAYRITAKFDKEGEKYSSGIPAWGVVFKAVRVYDPRFDSTYPGGSGACRWSDEATFLFGTGATPSGENPAIAALNYARGRFIEKTAAGAALNPPVKLLGCGFDFAEIEVDQFVELANICDANGWKAGGQIYEAPGSSKWDNLKRILQAAGAEPTWGGGKLGVKISAPRTSVVTIGLPDLADGELSVQAMKSWRDKINTVVPRVRLENQRWEYTQLPEVSSSVYVTEDGEVKTTEVQFDLVQQVNQGAQLAAYQLTNGREFGPVVLPLKPAFMVFQVGEAVTLNIPELGLANQKAIILGRQIDPATGAVLFSLESETDAKHSFALGQTSTAPPTPTITTPQERDQTTTVLELTETQITALILNSSTTGLTLSITSAGVVTISNHSRVYSDKTVAVTGATVTPTGTIAAGDKIAIWYDDQPRVGGVVAYQWARLPGGAGQIDAYFASSTNPYRHFVCLLIVPTPAASPGSGGSGTGGGSGGTGGPGGGLNPPNEN